MTLAILQYSILETCRNLSGKEPKIVNLNNWQSQLRKGLLDTVILNLLGKGRCHGYEMVQSLKQITALRIREGNIYPILARLQTDGLATCHQEPSRDGPPRKYYEITELGQQTVAQMNVHWDELTQSIQTIRKGS